MFQEFSTQDRTHAYLIIWLFDAYLVLFPIMYMLYILRLTVFSKALLDASFSCHSYANIWYQKQYICY